MTEEEFMKMRKEKNIRKDLKLTEKQRDININMAETYMKELEKLKQSKLPNVVKYVIAKFIKWEIKHFISLSKNNDELSKRLKKELRNDITTKKQQNKKEDKSRFIKIVISLIIQIFGVILTFLAVVTIFPEESLFIQIIILLVIMFVCSLIAKSIYKLLNKKNKR